MKQRGGWGFGPPCLGEDSSSQLGLVVTGGALLPPPQSNARKGGLLGLAATAVGLAAAPGPPEMPGVLHKLVPPILNSFTDKDSRCWLGGEGGRRGTGRSYQGCWVISVAVRTVAVRRCCVINISQCCAAGCATTPQRRCTTWPRACGGSSWRCAGPMLRVLRRQCEWRLRRTVMAVGMHYLLQFASPLSHPLAARSCAQVFTDCFEALFKICSDPDPSVQSAATFLDRLIKARQDSTARHSAAQLHHRQLPARLTATLVQPPSYWLASAGHCGGEPQL